MIANVCRFLIFAAYFVRWRHYISYDSAVVPDFGRPRNAPAPNRSTNAPGARAHTSQPMAQQPAWATPLCETGPSIQVGSGIVNPNIDVSTMVNGSCSVTVAIVNPNAAMTAMISARGTA